MHFEVINAIIWGKKIQLNCFLNLKKCTQLFYLSVIVFKILTQIIPKQTSRLAIECWKKFNVFTWPVPVLGFPAEVTRNLLRKRLTNSHFSYWLSQQLRQSRLLINSLCSKKDVKLLKLSRTKSKEVVSILI